MYLVFPAVLGVLVYLNQLWHGTADTWLILIYGVFVCLWGTFFLEFWKRHSNVLAFEWNVLNKEIPDPIRRKQLFFSFCKVYQLFFFY